MSETNGNGSARVGTVTVKQGLAQMLKGGVIVSALKRR
jgi:pyridoxal biosynthesis lyase PdxS